MQEQPSARTGTADKGEAERSQKLAIIGLDGATFDVIYPLIEEGKLPNIATILKNGTHAPLRSTIHPITPQAWSSFITGKNAGKHAIFDFRVRLKDTYTFAVISGGFRKGRSLWKILGEYGRKVGVLNVPYTYPAEEVNGYMIPGFDAPQVDKGSSYPEGIHEEIVAAIGQYYFKGTWGAAGARLAEDPEFLDRVIKNRADAARWLLTNKPWDLFMMVFGETDYMQHLFWKEMEDLRNGSTDPKAQQFGKMIERAYTEIDNEIGEIRKVLPDDAYIVLMSDHGGGPIKKHIHLNRLLANHGLIQYRAKDRSDNTLLVKMLREARRIIKQNINADLLGRIRRVFKHALDKADSLAQFSEIDWESTKAYSHGRYGNISINLKGREPKGTVSESEYFELREKIRSIIMDLRDPDDGSKVAEAVYFKEELFSGDHLEYAPDILIRWTDYAYFNWASSEIDKTSVFEEKMLVGDAGFLHSGIHRLHGIFAVEGPGIKKGLRLEEANIMDVTPTVIHLMGHPVPQDMDGRVLEEAFEEELLSARRIEKVGVTADVKDDEFDNFYSDKEEEEIRSRLSGLGYLE